jgi:hypothetical protein
MEGQKYGWRDRIPEATSTTHTAVHEWARRVAQGESASLLILGAHWSGKTHTMLSAYRIAVSLGMADDDAAAPEELDLNSAMVSALLDRHRVLLIDPADVADPDYSFDSEGLESYRPKNPLSRAWDDPEVQALMALREVAWQQLIERVIFSTYHASVFTATSEWTLRRALPAPLVDELLTSPTVHLPRRPLPPRLVF